MRSEKSSLFMVSLLTPWLRQQQFCGVEDELADTDSFPQLSLSLTMEAVLGGLWQPQLSAKQTCGWQACGYIHSDLYPPFLIEN